MSEDRIPPAGGSAIAVNRPRAEVDGVRVKAVRLPRQLVKSRQQAREKGEWHTLSGEELQHRARNTMALVRSVFERTMETGSSLEDVQMHFCGRLDVLARYMLPYSGRWDATVAVEDVIRNELRNFEFGDAAGITIKGPDAKLSPEQIQPFALMIHELATNALKFGALSIQNAVLKVSWKLREGCLKLVWAEIGVPIVLSAPVPRGFGREFIEEALPYQLGAKTQFELKPGGVLCAIELQLVPRYSRETPV